MKPSEARIALFRKSLYSSDLQRFQPRATGRVAAGVAPLPQAATVWNPVSYKPATNVA